jgi:predicted nucleotidyltransferase
VEKAHHIVLGLLYSGFVEADQSHAEAGTELGCYKVTRKGEELMRASAARRIKCTTAQSALDEFMQRVQCVNNAPTYLYTVVKVVVFGSFLCRGNHLGDVDVAVELSSRIPFRGNWVEIFRQHAWNSGRSFRTFDEEIDWPRREVILALKARQRSVSIHSWFGFIEMEKAPDFQYKVLLGNRRKIRGELVRSERERREESRKGLAAPRS